MPEAPGFQPLVAQKPLQKGLYSLPLQKGLYSFRKGF